MGFSPQQVEKMTHWQFFAALDQISIERGWRKSANDDAEPMSEERLRELGIDGF